MLPGKSKSKGNSFENKIAKMLSLWLTDNQRQDVLERSPASGGKATAHGKAGRNFQNIAGDIIAVAEEGMPLTNSFVIELKHQAETSLCVDNLIFQTAQNGVVAYWEKLLGECQQYSKFPMLIFRQNSRPMLIALCQYGVHIFECGKLVHAIIRRPQRSMNIIHFDTFLKKVSHHKIPK